MQRRNFIQTCSSATAAMMLTGISGLAMRSTAIVNDEIFVLVFLRGGCDGLQLVAPVNDPHYIADREPALRVTESGDKMGWMLKNGLGQVDFRLHAAAEQLKELYDADQMAIIHACGLTNGTRSHFDAQDMIEKGIQSKTMQGANMNQGWLARYLNTLSNKTNFSAIAAGASMPLSLWGSPTAVSVNGLGDFALQADGNFNNLIRKSYTDESVLGRTALQTFYTIDLLQKKIARRATGEAVAYKPEGNAKYLEDQFGKSLRNVAQLVKLDIGMHVATVDYGGWDTHEYQAYRFPDLVKSLSANLHAFYNDLNRYHSKLTVLVMSEFGRRVKGNKSNGTDHGYGNAMLALGGKVKGGKMYGNWKGLATEQLDNGVDLAVTTDYRTILQEVLTKRMNASKDLKYILPGFDPIAGLGFL
ncbi:MAG: DUF1501 domain-containing protein [Sphingobacteriia bacterium]|nr:MAG: DUF1501 domain-containing protein [Sphingobacteriia bacterium]